jgi:hypothetical protein
MKLLCESCGRALDTVVMDEHVGQLNREKLAKRGIARGTAPTRAGLPQVIEYQCNTKTCRRRVRVGLTELESAFLAAHREGRTAIRVGADLLGHQSERTVRTTTVTAKAPIPGTYRRPWATATPST